MMTAIYWVSSVSGIFWALGIRNPNEFPPLPSKVGIRLMEAIMIVSILYEGNKEVKSRKIACYWFFSVVIDCVSSQPY